ncbi:hypothetical protein G9A89_014334 [Geosiphon pyriformis]|nr:hypothetical protein G9A89_014334 [Geosiphon pyriformis]
MASKLPNSCIEKIFQFLPEDRKSLHSCILVNKDWCRQGITFLWSKPFSASLPGSLINTLITCLPIVEQIKYGVIKSERDFNSPTFPYLSYIKYFSLQRLFDSINDWCSPVPHRRTSPRLLHTFAINIVNGDGKILDLELDFNVINSDDYHWGDMDWNFFEWPGARKSLANLRRIGLNGEYPGEILYSASRLCTNISEIDIELNPNLNTSPDKAVFERIDHLIVLIAAQLSLKFIKIQKYNKGESTRDLRGFFDVLQLHSSTLMHLELNEIDLAEHYLFVEVISVHKDLERVVLRSCSVPLSNFYPQLPVESFNNLKAIEFHNSFISPNIISLLMLHSSSALNELNLCGLIPTETMAFLQEYGSNNQNLTTFEALLTIDQIPQILHVIEIWNNLKTLSLHIKSNCDEDDIDNFVSQLWHCLPSTVTHFRLDTDLQFSPMALQSFLMETEARIVNLDFRNSTCISDEHLEVIFEYGFVEYLNIENAKFITKDALQVAKNFKKFNYLKI